MAEDYIYVKGKYKESYHYFYDINGNETSNMYQVVARESSNDDKSEYYVRVEGFEPVHHDKFDKKNQLINPKFVKVTREIFENYTKYLSSKKEGLFRLVKEQMNAKGLL
jgi:hypothetical protein